MPSHEFEVEHCSRRYRGLCLYTAIPADSGDSVTPGSGAYAEDVRITLVEQVCERGKWRDATQSEAVAFRRMLSANVYVMDYIEQQCDEAEAEEERRRQEQRAAMMPRWR